MELDTPVVAVEVRIVNGYIGKVEVKGAVGVNRSAPEISCSPVSAPEILAV